MQHQCQDSDCRRVCEDGGSPAPLALHFPARTFQTAITGQSFTTAARTVLKCPWCRGNLRPFVPDGTQRI